MRLKILRTDFMHDLVTGQQNHTFTYVQQELEEVELIRQWVKERQAQMSWQHDGFFVFRS